MRTQWINGHSKACVPAPFAAVMAAMQLNDADTGLLRLLGDKEWRELLPIMDRARLTLAFARQSHSCVPTWVRERLESNVADTAQNWKHVEAAYREAAATLNANNVDHLVLKGFTQAPEFVPHPELRRQSDIDFYIPRESIPVAIGCLQKIGYSSHYPQEDYRYADHVPTLVRFGTWMWRGNIYDPDVPPAIEIHFCMWNESLYSIPIRDIDEFWRRRKIRVLGELAFPTLHSVDHIGYFSLHILRNIFAGESPVHLLRELAIFLNKSSRNDAFWREWSQMHSQRFRSLQAVAFSLAVAWFSCNIADSIKVEVALLPGKVQNWVDMCGFCPLESLFRRTRDGRLLQMLLVEAAEARKRILYLALAPGCISGPKRIAKYGTHPTMPTRPILISNYLAYPGYLCSRAWMNGCAVARFLAKSATVYFHRKGQIGNESATQMRKQLSPQRE